MFFITRGIVIAVGIFVALWRPSPEWIETSYANGFYPIWQHIASAITMRLPFALGDLLALLAVVGIVTMLVRCIRARAWLRALLNIGMIAAIITIWFSVSWGWNYDRAPIQTRIIYDETRATPDALIALRRVTMSHINMLAPLAHQQFSHSFDLAMLRASWLPVVQRLGDTWTPRVSQPKPTITGPFLAATGTGGYIDPFTLEVQVSPDELWFERPFDLAHEWTHAAAYAREDEANYVAALACIRSSDPVIAYSGWLELYLYLPPPKKYFKSDFVPLVWADFQAMRIRNAKHINLTLSQFSWHAYNAYLVTNHVSSGIANYNEITKLMLAIPRDANGLPVALK